MLKRCEVLAKVVGHQPQDLEGVKCLELVRVSVTSDIELLTSSTERFLLVTFYPTQSIGQKYQR